MAPAAPTRVLVVEDEPAIAEPFCRALAREGLAAIHAGGARAALELARREQPDVVVLDLMLPDGDGRDVCRELRRESDVPIIMLTARGTEADRVSGLELGADDYVVKPFSSAEVIARIRAILRRQRAAGFGARSRARADGPLAVGALRVDVGARRAWLGDGELDLTRREFDLLARLIADAGNVVTREDLIADVWDRNWFGSTKTLDVHVGWLRRKLGDDPTAPAYLHTVRGVGFALRDPATA